MLVLYIKRKQNEMKSLLPLLILIISFDVSSAYRPTVQHWSQGYGGALMMGEMYPFIISDESSASSPNSDQFQQPLVIKGLQVEKVIDGDTVYGLLGDKTYKIRLAEIDAPERDQPFGRQSKVFLRKLLEDGEFDVLFLIFFIMDIFGVSGEDVSNNVLDHRILLILLAFASMVISYFYLYKK